MCEDGRARQNMGWSSPGLWNAILLLVRFWRAKVFSGFRRACVANRRAEDLYGTQPAREMGDRNAVRDEPEKSWRGDEKRRVLATVGSAERAEREKSHCSKTPKHFIKWSTLLATPSYHLQNYLA